MAATPGVSTMATATTGPSCNSNLCLWRSDYPRLNPTKKMKWRGFSCTELAIHNSIYSSHTAPTTRVYPIRAQSGGKEPEDSRTSKNAGAFVSKEDVAYLWKLGVGSVVGAAVVKYGSVVFPEITRPNIVEALIIILTPVVVAVLILINQSRADRDQVS